MSENQPDNLAEWLDAEAGGSWDEADARFAAVAASWLPMSEVPAGLSERIMAAIPRTTGTRWARVTSDLLASWWVRATVGAAMLVLGVVLALVSAGQVFTFGAALVTTVARLGHVAATSLSAALGVWVAFWTVLVSLGRAAVVVTATRTASLVIVANLGLAALAFAGLTRLLAPMEEGS